MVGSDGALPLGGRPVVPVSPADPERSADRIMASTGPVAAVVAADTPMLILAAVIAGRMGLPHNPVDAVTAACDKTAQRRRWAAARLAQPAFRVVPAAAAEDVPRQAAAEVAFADPRAWASTISSPQAGTARKAQRPASGWNRRSASPAACWPGRLTPYQRRGPGWLWFS